MNREIDRDQVNHAAQEAWAKHLKTHNSGLDSYALGFQDAFKAGAVWQLHQDAKTIAHWRQQVGKLESEIKGLKDRNARLRNEPTSYDEPRKSPESAPLTEILAEVMEVAGQVRELRVGVQGVSDQIEGALAGITHVTGCDRDAILATVVDVGQKVEAVLDQVMPKDVAEPDGLTDIPGERLRDLEALNKQTYADPCAGNEHMRGLNNGIRLAHATIFGHVVDYIKPVDSKPVTDESGVSVGAGSFTMGADFAIPGTDKTVITIRKAEGSFPVTPPVWAGSIVDVIVDDRDKHARWHKFWRNAAMALVDSKADKAE